MSTVLRPTAGVAMCVYNGARYLREQLDSIASQSELPKCLAIVDDGSTDGSWELLQVWAVTAPFEVKLHRNKANVGVVRNFERAISLIDQDIVFLADQDDIWRENKVAIFLDVFQVQPSTRLLHSNADLIDGEGRSLGRRLFDTLLVTDVERAEVAAGKAYRVYIKRNLVTGAACAFRKGLLAPALPFSPDWIHDEWLAFTAALTGSVVMLDQPTMSYRLHAGNVVGLPITNFRWRLKTVMRAFWQPASAGQRLRARRLGEMHAHALRLGAESDAVLLLEAAARHAKFRSDLPKSMLARAKGIYSEARLGRYHTWSSGEASLLHDLFFGD